MHPRSRFRIWITLSALLVSAQIAWLWLLRGAGIVAHHSVLIGGSIFLGACIVAVAALLRTTPLDAIRLSRRTSILIILAATIALQATAIAWIVPALDDDLVRCRLDAGLWLALVNPYTHAPADVLKPARGARFFPDEIDVEISHPDRVTTYPPVAEAFFIVGRTIESMINGPMCISFKAPPADAVHPWRDHVIDRPWILRGSAFRMLFALCAIVATGLLIRLFLLEDKSVWWAVILGWNPLLTLDAGGLGHLYAATVMFIVAALLAFRRDRPVRSAIMLALAAGVHPIAIFLAPFLKQPGQTTLLRTWRPLVLFLAVMALMYAPMLEHIVGGWIWPLSIFPTIVALYFWGERFSPWKRHRARSERESTVAALQSRA